VGKNDGFSGTFSVFAKKNSFFAILEGGGASRIDVGFAF